MGTYYNPEKVEVLGTPVTGFLSASEGEQLVTILDNGLYRIAVNTTNKKEYDEFQKSYNQGHWLSQKSYRIGNEKLAQCPDEGRKPSKRFA